MHGELESHIPFPVRAAELRDECLLGLDFLDEFGACLNIGNKVLKLPGIEVPLVTPDVHAITIRRVKVALPPTLQDGRQVK